MSATDSCSHGIPYSHICWSCVVLATHKSLPALALTSNEIAAIKGLRSALWAVSLKLKSAQGYADLRDLRVEVAEALLSFEINGPKGLGARDE